MKILKGTGELPERFAEHGLYLPEHLRPDFKRSVYINPLLAEISQWADCLEKGCDAAHLRQAREAAGLNMPQTLLRLVPRPAADEDGSAFAAKVARAATNEELSACEAGTWVRLPSPWLLEQLASLYKVRPEYLVAYPLVLPGPLVRTLNKQVIDGLATEDIPKVQDLLRRVGGVPASTLATRPKSTPSTCSCGEG